MWLFEGKQFTENDIGDYVGFVYIITDISNNRKYIGKKLFSKAATKQIKGKKKRIRKKSDWESYFGSNKILQEQVKKIGSNNFKREILHLCRTRSECSYWESYEIFSSGALIDKTYYNDWISCRIRKEHLKTLYKHAQKV